jgi:hypothetical protein
MVDQVTPLDKQALRPEPVESVNLVLTARILKFTDDCSIVHELDGVILCWLLSCDEPGHSLDNVFGIWTNKERNRVSS